MGPLNYALRYFQGWGDDFVKAMDEWFGHALGMAGIAEFFPNKDTFVTLDPKIKDEKLSLHKKWSP